MENKSNVALGASEENAVLYSVLAYFGLLALIPLLLNKNNNLYIKFHTNQGIILNLVGVICGAVYGLNSLMLVILEIICLQFNYYYFIIFIYIWWFQLIVVGIICIFLLVEFILGIVFAIMKKTKRLPLVRYFNILK